MTVTAISGGDPTGAADPVTSGECYIAAMMSRRSDRRARRAFVDLAMQLATPGGVILDFGAGPGLDASVYAAKGYRVCGYDTSPAMRAAFGRVCRDEIRRGQVTLWEDDYETFLRSKSLPTATVADLVVANFAPMNLVASPREVFRAFDALTAPHGCVLVSILNPYFLGDLRYRWWWANRPALRTRGEFAVNGRAGTVFRRMPAYLAAQAAPFFRLDRVERGLPTSAVFRRRPFASLALLSCRYLFLVFTRHRTPGPDEGGH